MRLDWCRHLALGALSIVCFTPSLAASDLQKDTSLGLAPQDADLYMASYRCREQWEQFLQSKAVREIHQLDYVQKIVAKFKAQWESADGQLAQAKTVLKTPLAQDLIKLATEMASEEMFLFSDGKASQFLVGVNALNEELVEATGDGPEAIIEWFESLTREDLNQVPIPTFVLGFKFQDEDRALTLLDQLQAVVSLGLNSNPATVQFAEAFQRVEDGRGTRLVLNLNSSMLPWDVWEAGSDSKELIQHWEQLLEGRKAAITFGILDKYLILAVSEDAKQLTKFGKQGGSLAQHADLKPVMADQSKPLTGVAYVSDRFAEAEYAAQYQNYFSKIYRQLAPSLALIAEDGEIPEFLEALEGDLEWLDDEIDQLMPDFKGSLSYSYATKTGSEGWVFDRTESQWFDGSKRLDILDHVGSNPIMVSAMRRTPGTDWLALARKVMRKAKGYLEAYLNSDELEEEDAEELAIVMKKGWPLLNRFADVLEQKMAPATRDGQSAIVIAAGSLESKQWVKDMPPASTPLPLPEMAMVTGLSDKDLYVQGCAEIYSILDGVVDLVRELNPDAIPDGYSIPRPERKTSGGSEIFLYPIPEDCPVPKDMAPQVMVDARWAIASYSAKQSAELMKMGSSMNAKLQYKDRNLAGASYVDLGAFFKFAKPWLRYAIEMDKGDINAPLSDASEEIPSPTGKDVLDFIQALESLGKVWATTELDGTGTKTHWRFEE